MYLQCPQEVAELMMSVVFVYPEVECISTWMGYYAGLPAHSMAMHLLCSIHTRRAGCYDVVLFTLGCW